MKLKTKKSKIIFLILILLLIIFILGMILLILSVRPTTEELASEKLAYINDSTQWEDETIYPDHAAAFGRAYRGNLEIMSIGKSMYYVATEVLPTYYTELKDATDEEIDEYYDKESESIGIDLAIKNRTKFVNLVKELQKLSGDTLTLESYRIDLDTIITGANYTRAVLYIKYQGNDEIPINITANNVISSKYSTVEYSVNV